MALTVNWSHPLLAGAIDVLWAGGGTFTPVGSADSVVMSNGELALGTSGVNGGHLTSKPNFYTHAGDITFTFLALADGVNDVGFIAGYDYYNSNPVQHGAFGLSLHERADSGTWYQRGSFRLTYLPMATVYSDPVVVGVPYNLNTSGYPFYNSGVESCVSVALLAASSSDVRVVVNGNTAASGYTRTGAMPAGGATSTFESMGFGGSYRAESNSWVSNGAGHLGLLIVHNRKLTETEQKALTSDPWQVFNAGEDTVAPTLTSASASATGATTASGSVTTNEANGTLYWLVSSNPTATVAQVKAGFSQVVTSAGVKTVTLSGLTASTNYYLHFVHTDAAGHDSAVASPAMFTTSAPSGDTTNPTLSGVVTFSGISQTGYTASWPAGADNVNVAGYEYQIGSTTGAWTDRGTNRTATITGRSAGTTEVFYVRSYDAAGNRSTPAISGSVTTQSATVGMVNVAEPLKNNTGMVLGNLTAVKASVLQVGTLASVHDASNLTTSAGGILSTISSASIIPGQQYHVAIKLTDGSVGITGVVTAS